MPQARHFFPTPLRRPMYASCACRNGPNALTGHGGGRRGSEARLEWQRDCANGSKPVPVLHLHARYYKYAHGRTLHACALAITMANGNASGGGNVALWFPHGGDGGDGCNGDGG